jgi:hypothetical protein
MFRSALLSLCAMAFFAVGPRASFAQPLSRSAEGAEAQSVKREGFSFPRRLAGFERGDMKDFEPENPGLGFSFRYERPLTWADVYIYDKGLSLPRKADMAMAIEERERAIGDIERFAKEGTYERAPITSRGTYRGFARAALRITQKGATRDSFVYVAVHKGKFVKLRVSSTAGPASAKLADDLASALFQRFP